jgi:hypothetical protein
MDRKHLYEIPESIEHHPYLRWHLDPRLRRYIHQRIPDEYLPIEVLATTEILVAEVQQLNLDRQNYTLPNQNLSGSITALLAYILFSQRKVRLDRLVKMLQCHFSSTELRDVYQISLILISHPAKFLRSFHPQIDWYASLSWYSHNKFQKSLTDELRRFAGDSFKRTNLGLLNRCSSCRLEISLKQLGEKPERLKSLVLLHQCFQETVTAAQFSTSDPQSIHYAALLTRYCTRRTATDVEIADSAMAKELLTNLSNIIRHDRQQLTRSLDAPLSNDHEAGTVGDLVADVREQISLEDREMRGLALNLVSKNALIPIASTPPNSQPDKARFAASVLFCRYGLGLTQVEAGIELDCNQTTIGRTHDRQIAKLAKEFYLRYHKLLPTTQISIEILAIFSKYIESLCEDYYAELIIDLLTAVIENTPKSNIGEDSIDPLQTQLCQRIEILWQFNFKPAGAGLNKLRTFIINHTQNLSPH